VRIRLFSLLISAYVLTGCFAGTQQATYYEPLNKLQQEFYDIQTLYDTKKYKDTIQLGEIFLKRYPRDILAVSIKYYVASSYQKTDNYDEAAALYQEILKNHQGDEWAKLATVGLREITDAKKNQ
jgi:TolA-binding protein